MRCLWIMFVTAVCFLFLLKLKWPKNKNIQTGMVNDFEDFFKGKKLVFPKHLWNENFAYIPCISLRTCLCWLSLASRVREFSDLHSILRLRALHFHFLFCLFPFCEICCGVWYFRLEKGTQLKQDLKGFLFLLETRMNRDVLILEEIHRTSKVEFWTAG